VRRVLSPARDDWQASNTPFGKAVFQPAGLEAARTQRRDCFVGEHAIWAAAISDYLVLRIDLAKAAFKFA
jgi:hypothetical protein